MQEKEKSARGGGPVMSGADNKLVQVIKDAPQKRHEELFIIIGHISSR